MEAVIKVRGQEMPSSAPTPFKPICTIKITKGEDGGGHQGERTGRENSVRPSTHSFNTNRVSITHTFNTSLPFLFLLFFSSS